MSGVVFIGPTISVQEVKSVVDVDCWPPVAQGDVFRALQTKPRFIGIIDGYFDGVASVWHKEILWALSEGVGVLGASSMGALRAAELADFGMVGVGQIFQGYLSGELEDDDEVAVVHGPAELGYPSLSEPMVNIRPTLSAACQEEVLSRDQSDIICAAAKALLYRERTWDHIVERALKEGLSESTGEDFSKWLPNNRVDQKRHDAVELLGVLKQNLQEGGGATHVGFNFENTLLWEQGAASWAGSEGYESGARDVLDELIFSEEQNQVRQRSLVRMLSVERAYQRDDEFGAPERREITRHFRERAGLISGADLRAWMQANDLTEEEFKQLLVEELSVTRAVEDNSDLYDAHTLSVLKLDGTYQALVRRAQHKADILKTVDAEAYAELTPSFLCGWFFEERPDFGGFGSEEAFIAWHGLQSKSEFYTILAREYLYLQQAEPVE